MANDTTNEPQSVQARWNNYERLNAQIGQEAWSVFNELEAARKKIATHNRTIDYYESRIQKHESSQQLQDAYKTSQKLEEANKRLEGEIETYKGRILELGADGMNEYQQLKAHADGQPGDLPLQLEELVSKLATSRKSSSGHEDLEAQLQSYKAKSKKRKRERDALELKLAKSGRRHKREKKDDRDESKDEDLQTAANDFGVAEAKLQAENKITEIQATGLTKIEELEEVNASKLQELKSIHEAEVQKLQADHSMNLREMIISNEEEIIDLALENEASIRNIEATEGKKTEEFNAALKGLDVPRVKELEATIERQNEEAQAAKEFYQTMVDVANDFESQLTTTKATLTNVSKELQALKNNQTATTPREEHEKLQKEYKRLEETNIKLDREHTKTKSALSGQKGTATRAQNKTKKVEEELANKTKELNQLIDSLPDEWHLRAEDEQNGIDPNLRHMTTGSTLTSEPGAVDDSDIFEF